MARFVVTLSDEHRTLLGEFRKQAGLRSEADAVRKLIEHSQVIAYQLTRGGLVDELATLPDVRQKAPIPPTAAKPVKSRLKGEWKAP